jgi:hypothetical protein
MNSNEQGIECQCLNETINAGPPFVTKMFNMNRLTRTTQDMKRRTKNKMADRGDRSPKQME